MTAENKKMGFNATWSMAVGGMVGGGIFSVLGVVLATAAQWSWLSFLIAGMIALMAAYSYSALANKYKLSGGSFIFLHQSNHPDIAASLGSLLVLGYILTISVYAFTFGHYIAHLTSLGAWFPRVLALSIIAIIAFVNLKGIGNSSRLEIITVWGKLFVLLGLAIFGLLVWNTAKLTEGIEAKNWDTSIVGASTIFMAYEGFQLLSYDYDDIKNVATVLPKATISAIISVIIIYIIVTLGATMLVGAKTLINQKEVALAAAGKKAMGTTGLILVIIAAAFSTASAINATLFATARLMQVIAGKKQLPGVLKKENKSGVPYYSILLIAALGAALAMAGSLGQLVNAASLIFLITFGIVCLIAFRQKVRYYIISLIGAISCAIAIVISSIAQFKADAALYGIVIGAIAIVTVITQVVVRLKH
jgi:amino acid transporter